MIKTEGLEEALKEINEAIAQVENVSQAAFWEVGLKIIRASMKKAPVDTGNLRASAYVRSATKESLPAGETYTGEGQMPTDSPPALGVEVGYYAHYALNVHEMVEQKLKGQPREDFGTTREGVGFGGGTGKGTYWDTGEPKFLESVVMENRTTIPEIIKKRVEADAAKRLAKQ